MNEEISYLKKLKSNQDAEKQELIRNLDLINKQKNDFSERLEKLNLEIEEIKFEKDDSDRMRQEAVKKYENQLKALNQNLSSLRTDLKIQNEKLILSESNLNIIKGENLELEAKISNFIDERNELIERCVNSEKQHEIIRNQNIDLKRKLEDTQSALQELGQEHQILQVFSIFLIIFRQFYIFKFMIIKGSN